MGERKNDHQCVQHGNKSSDAYTSLYALTIHYTVHVQYVLKRLNQMKIVKHTNKK